MKSKKAQFLGLFCVCAHELQADKVEPIFQHAQDGPQIVSALHDQPAGGNDAVSALLSRQPNILFDAIERVLARLAIDGENRLVSQKIDRIVAPNPRRDLAAVKIEDGGEFMSVEGSATSRLPSGSARLELPDCPQFAGGSVSGQWFRSNRIFHRCQVKIAPTRRESKSGGGPAPRLSSMRRATFGTEIPLPEQIRDPARAIIRRIIPR